jgi:fructose-bisphosphate aldolase class I
MAERLEDIAQRMVAPGKGILAADESNATCTRRFDALRIPSTPDTRRDYREMLFRAGDAMRNFISGVILYDETIRQSAKDGTPLVKIITDAGAIPGIKVDAGTKPLALAPGESITEGLDGLRERLQEYHGMGARFAKWRAVNPCQCACPRPLRRAVPGNRDRPDRRAGSVDGRQAGHPRHRRLLCRDRKGAARGVR